MLCCSRNKRNEATVCYNEVGCFRDEGPFNYLDLLPAPPEEINTRFFLYTPRNRDASFPLAYNNVSSILNSPYNNSLPTKVMIHGFGSSCQRVWAKEMRTALISVVRPIINFRYDEPHKIDWSCCCMVSSLILSSSCIFPVCVCV